VDPAGLDRHNGLKPFRFAADISPANSRKEFTEAIRQVESLGYSAFLLSDHLMNMLAPVSALSMAAALTTRLRLGTFVFNNDLRHPVVLAQELAALDRLSDGRLEIGIGAGWNTVEYDAAGITFEPGPKRVERMEEAVQVVKGLFREGPFKFEGKHYRIKALEGRPLPIQQPHPPFLIGGGSPRVLRFAATNAEIVGLAPRVLPDGTPDIKGCTLAGTQRKLEVIREAAGSRLEEIEINTYPSLGAAVTDSRSALREASRRIRERRAVELTEKEVAESPHVFVGTVDGLVEKFQMLRERLGINYFFVGGDYRAFAPIVARLA
jgi:probable F420-dependent oxidoreductase